MDFRSDKSDKIKQQIAQLEEKKARLASNLSQKKIKLKSVERKARTHRLIQIGGLTEIAGIENCDRGALLGAFMELKPLLKDQPTFAMLKAKGDRILMERVEARKQRKNSPA